MPVPSYDREQQLTLLKILSAGLTTVLEQNEVELNDQAHLAKMGARTLVRVASLASDDDASIKTVLAAMGWTEDNLEGTDKIAMSMRVADLVATFREAKTASGTCDGKCGMTHVCQYCLDPDCKAYRCPVAKKKKE